MKLQLLSLSFLFLQVVISAAYAQDTQIQFLSGTDKDHTVDWDFHINRGMNSGTWTTIPVPSNWELQGFGVYNYGRGKQPESNEIGQYKHRFQVPSAWKGKTINIVFEGVMTDTDVYINGQSAGAIHQGSFYRFKYDISKLLKYGQQNLLEVTVKNWSTNASVNSAERAADYWVFGGIYRPVYLEALPAQHIDWTAIDAKANGDFLMHVYLNNNRNLSKVTAQVKDMAGKPVGSPLSVDIPKNTDKVTLRQRYSSIKIWSPEYPNRYQVQVMLRDKKGVVHQITEKFGFRTVELRQRDGIYVNDVKIKFKGVNRHSHWPESGRTTSKELSIIDVNLMKDMNMNAVRMSHYPPDKHFLEVCDSLGLFVLDELGGWQTYYDTQVGRKLVKEMLTRDVNHPSIIIWDNGNEGGNNTALDDDFYTYDPQKRPVIHPWENFRGTDTHHYRHFDCCVDQLYQGKEVFFPTEFLHGLYDGGHGAGLDDHWKAMKEHPLSAGMFLWVFADEGIIRVDQDSLMDTQKSNAPDGIVGPYREKEGSFYTIKEVWAPVQPLLKLLTPSFSGLLWLENDYFYTDLKECRFDVSLLQFPGPASQKNTKISKKYTVKAPAIAPGERGKLALNLPDDWKNYDALSLTITDQYNRELYTWVWPIQRQATYTPNLISGIKKMTSGIKEGNTITLNGNNVQVKINTETAQLEEVISGGTKISLKNGPIADTLFGSSTLKDVKHFQQGTDYVVEFGFEEKSVMKKVSYQMMADGTLKLHCEYLPKQGYYDYVGLDFSYPEAKVKGVRWLGHGPYRVWKNRTKGVELGIWEKAYNNTVTGEAGWEYPEFKGFHAQMYWAVIENDEKPFALLFENQDLYLRLFTPENPKGAYNTNTDHIFPPGDISIMHAISPVGTKFREAKYTGPSGQKNMHFYHRNVTHLSFTVYFDFDL